MPALSAVLAQNPLAGIFYDDAPSHHVHSVLGQWIGSWAGDSLPHQVVAAELAFICPSVYTPKADAIFREAGLGIIYPFLDERTVSLALAALGHWESRPSKAALKRAMARHLPREMVYRHKSAFVDPRNRVHYDPQFLGYLREAVEPDGPIAPLLHRERVLEAARLLERGAVLPHQTMKCAWGITFVDRWYRTAV
jgi:hypothetical protein